MDQISVPALDYLARTLTLGPLLGEVGSTGQHAGDSVADTHRVTIGRHVLVLSLPKCLCLELWCSTLLPRASPLGAHYPEAIP